jgi:P-type Na+/K+ transporter
MGDTIPADLRLFEAMNLTADEQSLTGESIPVDKTVDHLEDTELGIGDRTNIAYGTTTVQKGRGRGVVIATGMKTEVGKIAAVSNIEPSTAHPCRCMARHRVKALLASLRL